MHVQELSLPTNTARLAHQCLSNSQLILRGGHEHFAVEDEFKVADTHPLFLYPDQDAVDLTSEFLSTIKKPIQLIVPDGTWKQAKKFKRREKSFNSIQSVKIPYNGGSIYTMRKQKSPEGLCTFEAIAKALEIIENKKAEQHLMKILRIMVNRFEVSRDQSVKRIEIE